MRPLLEVNYPAERDAAAWERRHAAGEVPGRWPYGLDEIVAATDPAAGSDAPFDVVRRSVARPSRWLRAVRRVPLPALGRPRIGLGWDENMALRMEGPSRYRARVAGAIWVSDAVAAGRTDRTTQARLARLRELDAVWCLSEPQVDALREQLGPGAPPVRFVGFGVDPTFYAARPYPDRAPTVVSIGGDRDRDAATLFAALEEVGRARPGTGMIVQTTSELPPPPGVRTERYFTHRQLRELYAQASVVAIATRPNLHVSGMTVALEAMSTGRPVVLTRTPGMEHYVREGRTGFLTTTGDAPAMAERILHLLDHPDQAADLGAGGRRHVEEHASSARLAAQLRAIVTDVLP
ncbi:glycosyltransferase family 4 protein [Kineococcus gynurae]|uniref:Glycosyltransferase family 4 protein n=1 Tax=Kineococcus gynurae TaxID=452979 RepID=A0ABV5LXW7_9ACTN